MTIKNAEQFLRDLVNTLEAEYTQKSAEKDASTKKLGAANGALRTFASLLEKSPHLRDRCNSEIQKLREIDQSAKALSARLATECMDLSDDISNLKQEIAAHFGSG